MKQNPIVLELQKLVQTERKITAKIVGLIQTIDRMKIYLDYNHTSMFAFLTKEMGYTPASAQRRIDAARLTKELPEVNEALADGELNLSQVSMLVQNLRQKQKEQPHIKINKETKKFLLEKIKSTSTKPVDLVETQKILANSLDLNIKEHDKKTFQKDDSVRVEVTFSKEQFADLNRVKELISHQHPSLNMAELIEFLTKNYLTKKDPLQKIDKIRTSSKSTSVPVALMCQKSEPKRGNQRYIPESYKTHIFQRDQSCRFKDPVSDRQCESRFQLQIDHIKPLHRGGTNNIENLQLLCSVHNQLKYRQELSEHAQEKPVT